MPAITAVSAGLARLIGPDGARRRQLEAALLFVEATCGHVTGNELLTRLPAAVERRDVEFMLLELRNAGALRQVSRDREGALSDRYTVDPWVLRETLLVAQGFAQGTELAKQTVQHRGTASEIVATLPQGFTLPPEAASPIPLAAALHRLVVDAARQIVIVNPFFESNGLEFLHGALLAAAQRGVEITVITRNLADQDSPNSRALMSLHQELKGAGVAKQLSLFNYHLVEDGKTIITLHAKMVLCDEASAYVGSANLTHYGLERHLEVGVLLKGPQVALLMGIVAGVLHSGVAAPVEL